ncbi:MAG: hypothetical protein ACO1O1_13525 [Adhaeribacter sp.]
MDPKEEQQQKQLIEEELFRKMIAEHFSGAKIIVPQWDLSLSFESFEAQGHNLYRNRNENPDRLHFLASGFKCCSVTIDNLFSSFKNLKKTFSNNHYLKDHNTNLKILKRWEAGQPTTPPTIWMPFNKIDPVDGKHRINLSAYLGVKNIPIIIPVAHEEKISKKLKLELITP